MALTAAHLVDHVIPPVTVRQWVISLPKRLCCFLADRPEAVAALTKIFLAEIERLLSEEFPLECPTCGGDIRLIAFITEPGPIRKILTHLGEPLEPPPVSPARGPPTDWGELVQVDDDRDIFQASPDNLPAIAMYSR
jgi:hypothetical protein